MHEHIYKPIKLIGVKVKLKCSCGDVKFELQDQYKQNEKPKKIKLLNKILGR